LTGLIVLFFGVILVPGIKENVRVGRFDFIVLYTGGTLVKQGLIKHLYDYDKQTEIERNLTGRLSPLPFNHTPYEALLFAPLACFPYLWAYLIWALINLGLVALSAYLLRAYLENVRSLSLRLVFVLSVIVPLFLAIVHGQDSVLMLFFFTLALVSLKQGRESRAGCYLALALLKCQFVLPFVPVFFIKRRWRVVSAFLAVSVLLVLISFWAIGWGGVVDWMKLLKQENAAVPYGAESGDKLVSYYGMPNLRGFFYVALAGRVSPLGLNLLLAGCSVALVVWGIHRWGTTYQSERRDLELLLALDLVITLLVSYFAWPHDLVLVSLPILLTFSYYETSGAAFSLRRLIFVGSALLLFVVPVVLFATNSKHSWLLSWLLLALLFALSGEITGARLREAKAESP
jgi:hypothetical protein